jgi:hypothetical protein
VSDQVTALLTDEEILSTAKSKLSLRSDVHPSDSHFFVKGCVSGARFARDIYEARLAEREKLWRELLEVGGLPISASSIDEYEKLCEALGLERVGEPGGCTYCPDHLPQYRQQPAPAVAMTPALETLIQTCESWVEDISNYDDDSQARPVQDAIAAVRAQASQPQGVELKVVRAYFTGLSKLPQYKNKEGSEFLAQMLAELDAAEGKVTG